MPREKKISGIPASSGIAIGKAVILKTTHWKLENFSGKIENKEEEIKRLESAIRETKERIYKIRDNIKKTTSAYKVFDLYLLLLEDESIVNSCKKLIEDKELKAEVAIHNTLTELLKSYSQSNDKFFLERTADIKDLSRLLIAELQNEELELSELKSTGIIVAKDLAPSQTALFSKENVLGFVTDAGGKTSHSAIMAKSLGIPAVVGARTATLFIKNGDTVIIDGNEGLVIINPSPSILRTYKSKKKRFDKMTDELMILSKLPAVTKDGYSVILSCNIELLREIEQVMEFGGEGVGLYRTEFLFLNRTNIPDEEEQFSAYRKVVESVYPHHTIIRTIDLGGDKFQFYTDTPKELNPFLGFRAIRFCLEKTDVFKTQLRAILRASVYGDVKIMFPFISDIEEMRKAKGILNEVKDNLLRKKVPFNENIEVGIMVEVPSTAVLAHLFAREVDFFSIGTNDLIQYTLAVDRVNERISYLYDPYHPAILNLIYRVIDSAHKNRIWVGVCGEMAGDPISALLLVGMGVDELSASPTNIPGVKYAIRSMKFYELKEIAKRALSMATACEIKNYLFHHTPMKNIKLISEKSH
ncbi:MAG: phosphoenolpyruvate--protein phosphotransferase [bacterium]